MHKQIKRTPVISTRIIGIIALSLWTLSISNEVLSSWEINLIQVYQKDLMAFHFMLSFALFLFICIYCPFAPFKKAFIYWNLLSIVTVIMFFPRHTNFCTIFLFILAGFNSIAFLIRAFVLHPNNDEENTE